MSGSTKIVLPIAKAVGAQHQAPSANQTGMAQPQISVPPPTPLFINGRGVIIDVRSMSATDVINAINTVPGVSATIDGAGRLSIAGADTIEADGNLRAILGI